MSDIYDRIYAAKSDWDGDISDLLSDAAIAIKGFEERIADLVKYRADAELVITEEAELVVELEWKNRFLKKKLRAARYGLLSSEGRRT